jgi:ATP-dependent DNA helicase RecG
MNPAIEKLTKFFNLEAERGYDNRAVLGGLDQMLELWEAEARTHQVLEAIIQAVTSRLRDYPKLSPHSRKEALDGLWNRLRNEYPELKEISEIDRSGRQMKDASEKTSVSPANILEPEKQNIPAPASPETIAAPPTISPEPVYSKPAEQPKPTEPPAALNAPLTTIRGVGERTADILKKLGLETLGDLLWHFPRRYDDYSRLKPINRLCFNDEVTVIGIVEEISIRPIRKGRMKLVDAVISDGTGKLRVTWFNQSWIANRLRPGSGVVLSGRVDQYLGHLTMKNPEWELLEQQNLHTNRIVPVYPLTARITGKWLRRVINTVVTRMAPRIPDPLPDSVLQSADLMPLGVALQQIHFPDNWDRLAQAQNRLAFEEMFLLQLGVLRQKMDWEQLRTDPISIAPGWIDTFRARLPYQLTSAQETALKDIISDLAAAQPMNRLLQGDVGSGKTVIAAAAIAICAANGAQTALMAPTSILAEQHYRTMLQLLPNVAEIPPESIRLLIGGMPENEKLEIYTGLAEGTILVVVGTHALLEDPVSFSRLSLAVIDEQHRFGVNQRAVLRAKGKNPNLLVMTATPIPRSLSLTIYGDLDLTIIDEMPPGRHTIDTRILHPEDRAQAHDFIINQIENGHQAFIIYPLVEETDKIMAKAAVDEYKTLQEQIFAQYNVGLLHGRMRPEEKENIMRKFRSDEYDILVSTSVIEVGLDIPNATVMLVEGANRFGLAQLHQFRGRVGRGTARSYCLLIPEKDDDIANQRLQAMKSTNDGFQLAELDLEQRGPGDFLGTLQSGFADLKMAQLTDIHLIEKARREAKRLFADDPALLLPEHQPLAQAVARFWAVGKGEIS